MPCAGGICYRFAMCIKGLLTVTSAVFALGTGQLFGQTRDLPTSKQWIGPIPGHPQRLNSLPMSMAVSPDGRYVVTVNAGYGTFESNYEQSLAVLDTQTGALKDFPDNRTLARVAKQTLYSGLAFSRDGSHLYVSMGSITDPLGTGRMIPAAGSRSIASRMERLRRRGSSTCRCSSSHRDTRPGLSAKRRATRECLSLPRLRL